MLDYNVDTIVISLGGEQVEIAYTDTPKGILLDCLCFVHPTTGKYTHPGYQAELEDLIPSWHKRRDIKDMIHRSIYEC